MLKYIVASLALAICFSQPAPVLADEIVIMDAENNVRAQESVSAPASIEFILSDGSGNPADGFDIFLLNLESKQHLTQPVMAGKATFEGVEPGHWQVSSSVDWARFDTILILNSEVAPALAIGSEASSLGIIPPLVVVGAAAAGPAVAISNSRRDSGPLSPAS